MLKKLLVIMALLFSTITIYALSYQDIVDYSNDVKTIIVNGEKVELKHFDTGRVCPVGRYFIVHKKIATELEFFTNCSEIEISESVNGDIISFTGKRYGTKTKKTIKYNVKTKKIVK